MIPFFILFPLLFRSEAVNVSPDVDLAALRKRNREFIRDNPFGQYLLVA